MKHYGISTVFSKRLSKMMVIFFCITENLFCNFIFRKNGLRLSRIELADKVIDSAGAWIVHYVKSLGCILAICTVDSFI